VVVGHSDVIGAFLALARRQPGVRGAPFSLRNGSISLVELGADGRPVLIFANRLPDELSPP
jgi:broad specificity phosphatase PhoE